MEFDYTWNGITFTMEYHEQKDSSRLDWTDVEIASQEGDVVISSVNELVGANGELTTYRKKLKVASIEVSDLTPDAQESIRKKAFEFAYDEGLLNQFITANTM